MGYEVVLGLKRKSLLAKGAATVGDLGEGLG
jgi:hypothetical protein